VRLFRRNHREPVGFEDGTQKPAALDSGIDCLLRRAEQKFAAKKHKKHKRNTGMIRLSNRA
jgi:hypothetical protein